MKPTHIFWISMKKSIKIISIILVVLFVSGYGVLFFSPKPLLLEQVSFSKAIYNEQHQLLRLTLSNDEKYRVFVPLSQISPTLIEATLLQEDNYFYSHAGVNPWALVKAAWQTYVLKSRRVGASTITMQLVRLRTKLNSKKIAGKIEQIIKALQLEMHYSKKQILEAYLNLAPYGGNIEGVGAASLIYFNKPVHQLLLAQTLALTVMPQNPGKRIPGHAELKQSRDHLFQRWSLVHPEDQNKKVMIQLPLVMQRIAQLPFSAPHLVNQIIQNPLIQESQLVSTLDAQAQRIIENRTAMYLARKKALGVHNAAVLLVDTRDMSVKAMLGSANFFDKSISGQVNGVEAKRSPGSTLKPFIYGLALDQGLIHPSTMLKDVPHSFSGYNPENFDYDFIGPIKAKDALVLSRNVPAVFLSSQLTHPSLHQLLEQAQVSHLKAESYYGLSLNLGGVELTMRELASLYAMLVNDGIWYPIRFLQQEKKPQGRRLLSSEASFLVLDMLKTTPKYSLKHVLSMPVSWKTGTSSGYRDAWTIGSFGPYVLAVWIGNFDNKANPAFVGKDIAAPLFFELAEALKQEKGSLPSVEQNPQHMHLQKVEVCKASGMLPTRYCIDREWTWFIPGTSPIKTDTIFREVAINSKTGLRTCHIDEFTRFEIFEFWPSDLLQIFKKAGIYRHTPPFFESNCLSSSNNGLNPQITSPQAGISYVLSTQSVEHNKIPLSAVTDAGIRHLYWFINEAFIAQTKPGEPYLWQAKPGSFVVRVVDDRGLSDARDIHIQVMS